MFGGGFITLHFSSVDHSFHVDFKDFSDLTVCKYYFIGLKKLTTLGTHAVKYFSFFIVCCARVLQMFSVQKNGQKTSRPLTESFERLRHLSTSP